MPPTHFLTKNLCGQDVMVDVTGGKFRLRKGTFLHENQEQHVVDAVVRVANSVSGIEIELVPDELLESFTQPLSEEEQQALLAAALKEKELAIAIAEVEAEDKAIKAEKAKQDALAATKEAEEAAAALKAKQEKEALDAQKVADEAQALANAAKEAAESKTDDDAQAKKSKKAKV